MTIGIDASRANNTQKTGVEWYAFFLIEELKKITPPDVHVVLYSEKPLEGELAVLPSNWSSKVLNWPPKRFWTQIRLSFEMIFHAPDVLFIPAHVFPLFHPLKTVMTVHDVAAHRFANSYNWFERWYSLWSAKYAIKNLWKVIVPSDFTDREVRHISTRFISTNIALVHHGFDPKYADDITDEETVQVLKKYDIKKPFFITLGRLEEKKNTVRIIEAFQTLKQAYSKYQDYQLVLVGKPGYGFEKVQALLETSLVKNDIKVLGWLEPSHVSILLAASEALVFPSLYEGFGLPILEAFAAGTAVITSKDSSTEEIGDDAVLLVNPQDTEDITDAMINIIEEPEFTALLKERGRKRVADFSWKKCAKETLALLTAKE